MTTILDVFTELSNSQEALDMIFQKYISSSYRGVSNITIAHNKLKTILKQNNKKSLVAKYKKISGDTLIILAKQIASESLEKYGNPSDVLEFIKSSESKNLIDLERFCIGILNFNDILNDNLDLILKNYNQKNYIFKGIKQLEIKDEIISTQNLELEMKNIKSQMKEIQKRLEILYQENTELRNQKEVLSSENKLLKKEIKKSSKIISEADKKINKAHMDNDFKQREIIGLNKKLDLREEEILNLNKDIEKQNEILKNAIILDEFIKPETQKPRICVLHTSDLILVDKIHYDVKFIKYMNVTKQLKSYIKKLKSEGIFKIALQSNSIESFKIQEIMSIAKAEKMEMYRLSFNTEKELCEKLSILK